MRFNFLLYILCLLQYNWRVVVLYEETFISVLLTLTNSLHSAYNVFHQVLENTYVAGKLQNSLIWLLWAGLGSVMCVSLAAPPQALD